MKEHSIKGRFCQLRIATCAICIPSDNCLSTIAQSTLSIKYVEKELGQTYNCYIAEVTEELGADKLLGTYVYVIEVRT